MIVDSAAEGGVMELRSAHSVRAAHVAHVCSALILVSFLVVLYGFRSEHSRFSVAGGNMERSCLIVKSTILSTEPSMYGESVTVPAGWSNAWKLIEPDLRVQGGRLRVFTIWARIRSI